MKAFIAGVCTLTVLILAVTVNAIFITNKLDSLLAKTEALPQSASNADISELKSEWEGSRSWIALCVHRESVDKIDDTLAQLMQTAEEGNDTGYLSFKTSLFSIIERLKETESFSLNRIF